MILSNVLKMFLFRIVPNIGSCISFDFIFCDFTLTPDFFFIKQWIAFYIMFLFFGVFLVRKYFFIISLRL